MEKKRNSKSLKIDLTRLEAEILIDALQRSFRDEDYLEVLHRHYLNQLKLVCEKIFPKDIYISLASPGAGLCYLYIGSNTDYMIYNTKNGIHVYTKGNNQTECLTLNDSLIQKKMSNILTNIAHQFNANIPVDKVYDVLLEMTTLDPRCLEHLRTKNIISNLYASISTYDTLNDIIKDEEACNLDTATDEVSIDNI